MRHLAIDTRTWPAASYVATTFVLGTISFVVLLTLVVTAAPMMLLALIGLPLLWLAFSLAHLIARFEGWRARELLGADLAIRELPGAGEPFLARMLARTRSKAAWLELLHGIVVLPFSGWLLSTLVFIAWGGGLGFVLFPAYGWATPAGGVMLGWDPGYGWAIAIHVVLGIGALLAAPWLTRAVARWHAEALGELLGRDQSDALSERVETLTQSRADMVAAADAERRRIERDLHDGAQQRLVALAMTLGRAQQRFADDPDSARLLICEAHEDAKQALGELRDLARGIHPAVLADRGFDAALSALAARSPVPVKLDVDVPHPASPAVEAVAYFVVAEALTNVVKHAHARHATVVARGRPADGGNGGGRLVVEVVDDGRGGAQVAPHAGLAGLRDRVHAVDGTFTLTSPPGGPTALEVELPCG